MNEEPRQQGEYSRRQTEAARRVLVDVGQVLGAFSDCIVVVGGWVPDLLIEKPDEPHIGSIDVDLALDVGKLTGGRYAEMLQLLLATRRYRQGAKPFQLVTEVDQNDAVGIVQVEVEFLAPKGARLRRGKRRLTEGFRVLQADGCASAFRAPVRVEIGGKMIRGARNSVTLLVASLQDFLVMKAHALAGRDKPKDAYDLCYCLDYYPGGLEALAEDWRARRPEKDVEQAISILARKFSSVEDFGPAQVVEFLGLLDADARAMQARRAFELVRRLLSLL